jgi:hypothetical protein
MEVNAKDRVWVDTKLTPQPIGVSLQKIRLTGARDRVATKTYVRAANSPNPLFDRFLEEAKAKNWRTFRVPGGHDVMIDSPTRLAEILLEVS